MRNSVNHIILNIENKSSYEIIRLIEELTLKDIKNFVLYGRYLRCLNTNISESSSELIRKEFLQAVERTLVNLDTGSVAFIFITSVKSCIIKYIERHQTT